MKRGKYRRHENLHPRKTQDLPAPPVHTTTHNSSHEVGGDREGDGRMGGIIWFSGDMERGSVVTNRVYVGDYRKLNANLLQMRGVWDLKMLNRLGGG